MSDEQPKERIGDYELVELIGDGAQGRVYKACCMATANPNVPQGEMIALKVLRLTGDDEKAKKRFLRQADILRRLSHTNIVRYRDSFTWHEGEWDEAECLVMEFLDGETLHNRLKQSQTGLPWSQVEEIFEQCLAGLLHAREQQVTHRDLKPSNIFLCKDGTVKLIDFDIARRDDAGQTSTTGWRGTFDYMAPDFITGEGFRGDEVSDIFSLGVCFYQTLTGALPFEPLGEGAHIGYLNRWRQTPPPEPSFRHGVFRVLSHARTFAFKSIQAPREQRYQTFREMLEEFRKIHYRRIQHRNKDEYELLAVLGRGGFGEVFKGRRLNDGTLVAIKHLFADRQSERFIKEAKIIQQYSHPNLVRYIDFLSVVSSGGEKQFFLILEFLEGMPGWALRNRIKNEGKLDLKECLPLFGYYLDALNFLHGHPKPIIHRDIKPGNLYAPAGQPDRGKIFDMGVARDVTGTVTYGGVPGTLDYMAPEFCKQGGDRGSPQSDIYAIGLCLYESVTGRSMFGRLPSDMNSAWAAFQTRIQNPPAVDYSQEAFVQCPALKGVIARAVAENPEDRFPSAVAMRLELQTIVAAMASGAAEAVGRDAEPLTSITVRTAPAAPVPEAPKSMPAPRPAPGTSSSAVLKTGGESGAAPVDEVTQGTRMVGTGAMPGLNVPPVDALKDAMVQKKRSRYLRYGLIGAGVFVVLLAIIWASTRLSLSLSTKMAERQSRQMEIQGALLEEITGRVAQRPVADLAYVKGLEEAQTKVRKMKGNDPELAEQIKRKAALLEDNGKALPAEFRKAFDAAIAQEKTADAQRILADWQEAGKYVAVMGIAPDKHTELADTMKKQLDKVALKGELDALTAKLPKQIRTDDELAQAEDSAKTCKRLKPRVLANSEAGDLGPKLKVITDALDVLATAYVTQLRDAALTRYSKGEDGAAERERLKLLGARAPALIEVVQVMYGKAVEAADAARDGWASANNMETYLSRVNQAKEPGDLVSLLKEYAGAEKSAKVKPSGDWTRKFDAAVVDKFAEIGTRLFKQANDEYEAEKIADGDKTRKGLLDFTAGLPETYDKKELTKHAQSLESTRKDVTDKIAAKKAQADLAAKKAADDAAKKIEADRKAAEEAAAKTAAEEAARKAEADKKAQAEAARAAGKIFDKPETAGKTATPTATPAATPAATPTAPPVTPAATAAPAVAVPAGMGILMIEVSPHTAVLLVDDKIVEPGSISVSADRNHKITVQQTGYATYEQYYRVDAGKTKTVGVLLQKKGRR